MTTIATLKKLMLGAALALTAVTTTPQLASAQVETRFDAAHWAKFDANQAFEVDHTPMTNILKFITVKNGGRTAAAYQALEGKALDYVRAYKRYLLSVKVTLLNRDEQLAYWLNLHNLGVIEKIAKDFDQKGAIKKLRGEPGKPGEWWSEATFVVEGYRLSLEDVEQRILIEGFQEPLVLYGLCYGVRGSSLIGTEAFKGKTVRQQLAKLATDFINDSSNVRASRNRLRLNSLYVWNQDSLFGGSNDDLLAHISTYADKGLKEDLADLQGKDFKIQDRFSWRSDAFVPRAAPRSGGNGGGFGGGGGGFGGGGS